ncbi:unnamed protein product [Amoebophrya sp. A25]|nr:unnamed protein product [Amoebophrya sp. A25]|eukprot:GSA25T00003610001.1
MDHRDVVNLNNYNKNNKLVNIKKLPKAFFRCWMVLSATSTYVVVNIQHHIFDIHDLLVNTRKGVFLVHCLFCII